MSKVLFTAMLLSMINLANAESTNFSYSTLGVSGGSTTLGTALCSSTYCYKSFGNAGISGSYQFNDNFDWLVLSVASGASLANGNNGDKLTESDGSSGINIVKAISNTVDFGVGINSLSSTVQYCTNSNCTSTNDTGVDYFVGLKGWLNETRNLSVTVEFDSYKYTQDTSSTSGYGLALGYYPTKNSELSFAYSSATNSVNTSSTATVAYTYHFYSSAPQVNNSNYTTNEAKPEPKPVEMPKATPTPSKANTTTTDKLLELNNMHQQGLINDSEYATKKKAILEAM
jgi:hypothetical protein